MKTIEKVLYGATGVALTLLTQAAVGEMGKPARERAQFDQDRAHYEEVQRATEIGFNDAICTADAEGLLILPPAPYEILAEHEPIYNVQAGCPESYREAVAGRRHRFYIQRGY